MITQSKVNVLQMKRRMGQEFTVLENKTFYFLYIFVSVKIKIKSNIHIPLSSSVSMISAGSVWRNGKSTAHQREAIIDAPAMRSSSRWRSSQRR